MTEQKFHRTLVRVEKQSENFVYFIVPAWNTTESVCVHKTNLPKKVRDLIAVEKRFFAMVNIAAEFKHKIEFKDWEIE